MGGGKTHWGGNRGTGGQANGGAGDTTHGAGVQKPNVGTSSLTVATDSMSTQTVAMTKTSSFRIVPEAVDDGDSQTMVVPGGAHRTMVLVNGRVLVPMKVQIVAPVGEMSVMLTDAVITSVTSANPVVPMGVTDITVHVTPVTVTVAVLPAGIFPHEWGISNGVVGNMSVWKQKS